MKKFKYLLTCSLLVLTHGDLCAAFQYDATHPSGQEITDLVSFDGGLYAGHRSSTSFPIYRYDPTTKTHSLERTLSAATASKVMVTPGFGIRAPMLVVLGEQPVPSATGDFMAMRLQSSNTWSNVSNSQLSTPGYTITNVTDMALAGYGLNGSPGEIRVMGKNLNSGQAMMIRVLNEFSASQSFQPMWTRSNVSFCIFHRSPNTVTALGFGAPHFTNYALVHGLHNFNCEPLTLHQPNQLQSTHHVPQGNAFSSFGANGLAITESVNAFNWTFTIQGGDLYSHRWNGRDWEAPVLAYGKRVHDIIEYKQRLILLDEDGKVCYSSNARSWNCIDTAPITARQITIDTDRIYVGTVDGEIWSTANTLRNLTSLQAHALAPQRSAP